MAADTGAAGSPPFRPAAAQIDQLHAATRAKSSLFSAEAVTHKLEMPFELITDGRTDCGAKYLQFIEGL